MDEAVPEPEGGGAEGASGRRVGRGAVAAVVAEPLQRQAEHLHHCGAWEGVEQARGLGNSGDLRDTGILGWNISPKTQFVEAVPNKVA